MAQQAQQAQRWLEGPLGSHGAGCGQDGRSPGLTSAISEGDKSSAAAEGGWRVCRCGRRVGGWEQR